MLEAPHESCIQEERRPSLSEYKEKWNRLEQQHTRPVRGNFGNHNLVPTPVPQLFQNCPWVPFHVLTAEGASDGGTWGFAPAADRDGLGAGVDATELLCRRSSLGSGAKISPVNGRLVS